MFDVPVTSTTMKLLPLACLCLLTRSGTTFADGNGPSVINVAVEEGSDVMLPCSFSTKKNIEKMVFDWKKDGLEVFLYEAGKHYNKGRAGQDELFKGRVFHFEEELKNGNASIKVQKTKMADSGNYTCTFPNEQISHIKLVVGAAPEPYVTSLEDTKDWSLLQCVVRGASPKPTVEWQDSAGNILPAKEPQVSERGGSYDIILQTTVSKTDRYRCVATQEEINHQIHAEISVYIHGAAPEPYITILDETKDWSLLQCVVRGASPKPTVEWQDSAGNILPVKDTQVSERGGSYDIILQTTVTKTDRYRCVATQEEINHQIHAEISVHISGQWNRFKNGCCNLKLRIGMKTPHEVI
ncbi:CD276 antigen homolog [Enoplosus armatus]|uniref:CD276 antigen homolog n=1 Tax=Enoplosus armatus TaxID=215367 RepID=UPI0039919EE7